MQRYQPPTRAAASAALAIIATTAMLWIAVVAPAQHAPGPEASSLVRNTTADAAGGAVMHWRIDVVGVRGAESV